MFKNKFNLSLFSAFMLSKANHIATRLESGPIEHDFLENILKPAQHFFQFFGIDKVKALPIFNLPYGFEGTTHTLNFLLTYTPLFFIIFTFLFNFKNLVIVANFIKEKLHILKLKRSLKPKNQKTRKTKNQEYKLDLIFLLYLKLTRQYRDFKDLPDYQDPKILEKLEVARKQLLTQC